MVYKESSNCTHRKREAIILSNANFVRPLQPVMIGNKMIEYVRGSTSLGVKIDNKINRKSHLTKVTNSFNSKFKEMRRPTYFPIKIREDIYLKTVVSSRTYYISVWGASSNFPWMLWISNIAGLQDSYTRSKIGFQIAVSNSLLTVLIHCQSGIEQNCIVSIKNYIT